VVTDGTFPSRYSLNLSLIFFSLSPMTSFLARIGRRFWQIIIFLLHSGSHLLLSESELEKPAPIPLNTWQCMPGAIQCGPTRRYCGVTSTPVRKEMKEVRGRQQRQKTMWVSEVSRAWTLRKASIFERATKMRERKLT
jgi:hypothetical protein